MPKIPLSKRDIRQKIFDKEQYNLYNRINRAKPQISSHPRRDSLSSQSRRLKPNQIQEDRQGQIDHDNRRLLQNIAKILRRDKTKSV